MSRRLARGIVRAYRDERTADARRSRRHQEAIFAQWPNLPAIALPLVRDAARLDVDAFHVGSELDIARQQGRRKDVARLRRQISAMRRDAARLLEQIETLSKTVPPDAGDLARRLRARTP